MEDIEFAYCHKCGEGPFTFDESGVCESCAHVACDRCCINETISEEKNNRFVWNTRIIEGFIAEQWIKHKLGESGHRFTKTMAFDRKTNKSVILTDALRKFLEDQDPVETEKLLFALEKLGSGIPDFICLKNGEISFAEVKSNKSPVRENQNRAIAVLQKMGYDVVVRRLKASFMVEEEDAGDE